MRRIQLTSILGMALVALTACAPTSPAAQTSAPASQSAAPQRTLVMAAAAEPGSATPRIDQSGGFTAEIAARLFTAGLVFLDDQGAIKPYLAEEPPKLNSDSWKVNADGTMDMTYRLKPDLTWHDGAP